MNTTDTVAEMEGSTNLRPKSRFDQFNPACCYEGASLRFPASFGRSERDTTFDISHEAAHHGFRSAVHVSGALYCQWITGTNATILQRIGTLCHAFLHHVDLDRHDAPELIFPVPFYSPGCGSAEVFVRATLKGYRSEYILFELAE